MSDVGLLHVGACKQRQTLVLLCILECLLAPQSNMDFACHAWALWNLALGVGYALGVGRLLFVKIIQWRACYC
jgi:hypothetical protein